MALSDAITRAQHALCPDETFAAQGVENMEKETSRENLSEMELIHRGLEAFLEKEVYEGYETESDAGPEHTQQNGYEECEYDEYVCDEHEYGEYEDEEPVRTVMARQSANKSATRQRASASRAGAGKSGRKEQTTKSQSNGKGTVKQRKDSAKGRTAQRQGNGSEQSAKKKKHKGIRRFLTVVVVLLLAVTALWYVTVSKLYDKMEYAPTEILADEPMKEDGVTNILLIGNDSRQGGEDGRSDAMILVSISNRTKTIYMTSLLRDIYVEIPGHESNRLNAAYAFGGPELLLETIKQNLDIEVNRYVQVNFQAFANLIDAVGGVELELTNEEVQLVNAYLNEYNMLENRPIDTDYLPTDASGLLHLNGPQALAYSRNRYIGSDFGRTERQRKILEAVFHQLPSSMLTNSGDMIDGILPNLTTNISKSECYALSLDAPKLLTYEIVQASIPIEGSYQNATIRKMSVLQVDFEKNKEFIRTQIYGEQEGE